MARSKRSSRRRKSMKRRKQSGGLLQMLGGKAFSKDHKGKILASSIFNIVFSIFLIWNKYENCNNLNKLKSEMSSWGEDNKKHIINLINQCSSTNTNIFYGIAAVNILISIICIVNIDNAKLASILTLVTDIILILHLTYNAYIFYKAGKISEKNKNDFLNSK